MCNYYIGQRVKVVAHHEGTQVPIGYEGRITGPLDVRPCENDDGTAGLMLGYEVDRDWLCAPEELEPILPEGAAPSEYTYTELMDRLKAGEVERV